MATTENKVDAKAQAEKVKALELAVQNIEKQFGKGSIMRLGANDSLVRDVEVIPTGALSLDIALGIGGLPRGRIVEIYGPFKSETQCFGCLKSKSMSTKTVK